jgi:NADH-quinone oxidoreductase subunit J
MVLVVFVIMLLGLDQASPGTKLGVPRYLAAIFCGAFVGVLGFVLTSGMVFPLGMIGSPTLAQSGEFFVEAAQGSPREVGMVLLTEFLYPFQLASLLLLAAIIGAVLIAYEKKRPLGEGRGLRAVQQDSAINQQHVNLK